MIGSVRGRCSSARRRARCWSRSAASATACSSRSARSRTSTPAHRRSCSRTSTCAKTRMVLYGFPTRDERDTFEVAHRRDRRRARSSRSRCCRCTRPRRCGGPSLDDDLDALTLVPGVGKRTAQRLLVELKARLDVPDLDLDRRRRRHRPRRGEVREALAGLGYAPDEVRDVVGAARPTTARSRTSCARRSSSSAVTRGPA